MGKYEVTIGQYLKFCKGQDRNYPQWLESGSIGKNSTYKRFVSEDPGDKRPIVGVNWYDAGAYCRWLLEKTGLSFRLPTEAEWEYACRAGTTTTFSYGNSLNSNQANFYVKTPKVNYREETSPVGSFDPNPWGIYDMHGNVREWCNDWYGEDYYSSGISIDPRGPSNGTKKSLRGRRWGRRLSDCRSAFRYGSSPKRKDKYKGFRLAMESR